MIDGIKIAVNGDNAKRGIVVFALLALTLVLAGNTPLVLQQLMGRLDRGEPLFDIRHQSGRSLERHMLHASNRPAFALIVASLIVGSATILAAHAGPHIGDVPVLGIIGFVVAGVLGVWWAVIALKSGRL